MGFITQCDVIHWACSDSAPATINIGGTPYCGYLANTSTTHTLFGELSEAFKWGFYH
jgi:hypothetical protein